MVGCAVQLNIWRVSCGLPLQSGHLSFMVSLSLDWYEFSLEFSALQNPDLIWESLALVDLGASVLSIPGG